MSEGEARPWENQFLFANQSYSCFATVHAGCFFRVCTYFTDTVCGNKVREIPQILRPKAKHLTESDWFLPVFISHYIDMAGGALGMFHADVPGPGLIHQNAGFYFWSKFALILSVYLRKIRTIQNKGIGFNVHLVCIQPDKTRS